MIALGLYINDISLISKSVPAVPSISIKKLLQVIEPATGFNSAVSQSVVPAVPLHNGVVESVAFEEDPFVAEVIL